jgi:hypothetical protein
MEYLEALELALHGLHLHLELHNSNTSRESYQKQKPGSKRVGSIFFSMVMNEKIPSSNIPPKRNLINVNKILEEM